MATTFRQRLLMAAILATAAVSASLAQDANAPMDIIGLFKGFNEKNQMKQRARTIARGMIAGNPADTVEAMVSLSSSYIFAFFNEPGELDSAGELLLRNDANPQAALKAVLIADELTTRLTAYTPPNEQRARTLRDHAVERTHLFYRLALRNSNDGVVYRALQSIVRYNIALERLDFGELLAPLANRESAVVRFQTAETAKMLYRRYQGEGNMAMAQALRETMVPAMVRSLNRERSHAVQLKLIEAIDEFMPTDNKFGWQGARMSMERLEEVRKNVLEWGREQQYLD